MHNPSNKEFNKICILQRYKRINERLKSSIQSINRRISSNKGIFEEKWDKKYPMFVSSWKITGQNYPHISNIQKG
ncbi:hypothetical protein SKB0087_16780 [Anaerococcus nagyae]